MTRVLTRLAPLAQIPPLTTHRRDLVILLTAFAVTRLFVVVIGVLSMTYLDSTQGEEYTHLLDGGPALDMWYRWDAGFYATIAIEGYDWVNEQQPTGDMAFFPLYPGLIHLVSGLTPTGCALSPYLSTCATLGGLLVSNVALFAATVVLFDLVRRRFDRATAWRAALLLLVSPISIFLSGVYTESLFLLLSLLTFWLIVRRWFLVAIAVAMLACLTRSVGVALYPALLYIAWQSPPQQRILRILLAQIPLLIFVGYILGAGLYVGDPFAYFGAYEQVWGRTAGNPIEAFTIYFSGAEVALFGWHPAWLDLILTLIYLALAVLVWRKDRAWGLFTVFALLIPIASGTLSAMPRYGAVIFPLYIVLALYARQIWSALVIYGASLGLALLTISRFVTWKWIA
ncbi:MAG: glycosyltransferase family 39 protein [Chloroflexi bacterium]|uniref:mannosyltransferase family protein n=1 Tax=Candidatus Flexifilum breve TaxID=3140694 RepID=UPI00313673B1|nr:glycosyltransferase family 39 protein [Chloroflexota bacterium]